MNDGARTRDNRNHNPGLYQLSYVHHLARLAGFEPATLGLEGRCSIRMSYRRITLSPKVYAIFNKLKMNFLVGVEGFEPPTSCSQSRRATRLRYTPTLIYYSAAVWDNTRQIVISQLLTMNNL